MTALSRNRPGVVLFAMVCWIFGPRALADELPGQRNSKSIAFLRVPDGGIQPQASVDSQGVLHLIYFLGDPKAGDIYYVRSEDGVRFSKSCRVNSEPGSAMAIGNIRGAHLALGKNGRAHVAWMGTTQRKSADSHAHASSAPMLYARLNDAGTAFEPQRNLIQTAFGLDGGGSIAADDRGNVYVAWHAPEPGSHGEDKRCVWMTRSTDEGKSFGAEARINPESTGVCGCCGMRIAAMGGAVFGLYRSAHGQIHRDMYLLASSNHGNGFRSFKLDSWNVGTCPMSSMNFGSNDKRTLCTWETEGQVYFATIDSTTHQPSMPVAAPGSNRKRKHSAIATNAAGEVLLVWTEGMGWSQGGTMAWQLFDASGKPMSESGQGNAVPAWSLVAAIARPDGRFVVIY